MTPRVRVNALHPGVIWTEMITGQFGDSPELAAAFRRDTPCGWSVGLSTWPTPSPF